MLELAGSAVLEIREDVWRMGWNVTGTVLACSGDSGAVSLWKCERGRRGGGEGEGGGGGGEGEGEGGGGGGGDGEGGGEDGEGGAGEGGKRSGGNDYWVCLDNV